MIGTALQKLPIEVEMKIASGADACEAAADTVIAQIKTKCYAGKRDPAITTGWGRIALFYDKITA